jgi:hypothetical protein
MDPQHNFLKIDKKAWEKLKKDFEKTQLHLK